MTAIDQVVGDITLDVRSPVKLPVIVGLVLLMVTTVVVVDADMVPLLLTQAAGASRMVPHRWLAHLSAVISSYYLRCWTST